MNNVTLRVFTIMFATAAMASAASAQLPPTSLSPKAQAAVEAWRGLMVANRAFAAALPPPQGVAEELAARVALEQSARQAIGLINQSRLPQEDIKAALAEIWRDLGAVDTENTAYLKTVLPADGWFRISRDGARVASDAFLIVQHSPDRSFQRQVIAAMEPLARQGEVNGQNFALLYDRNEMFDGRPQRYGSQGTCKNGVMSIHTLEDPARVDELRRSVGMTQPLAEYSQLIGVGKPC